MRTSSSATLTPPQIAPTLRRFRMLRAVSALILREMQTTYGRSPGGYLWAVIEPAAAITLFTAVISIGLQIREPSVGTSFALFYATGYLPFALTLQMGGKVAYAIKMSRPLLVYPGVRLLDAILARFLLNFLLHIVVFAVIATGVHLLFDIATIRNIPAILAALSMAGILGLAVGIMNSFMFWAIPVWESGWSILIRPLFLLSPVIYAFDDIPGQFRDLLWFNPLVHTIGMMRRGFYATYDAAHVSALFVVLSSMTVIAFFLMLLRRYQSDILN